MENKIKRFLAYDGKINIITADTTNLVEEIRKLHDLSPVTTAALGRLVTISLMMAIEMKNYEDRLSIIINGNGPIGKMITVTDKSAQIKTSIENGQIDIPLNEFGKLDVGNAVGMNGYINVIKDIGLKEPYVGMVPIVSGEIGDDFANYFMTSEQQKSAVGLGVLVDKNGVKSSGGYLIRVMPDAKEEDITKIEESIFKAGSISKMLDKKLSIEEIAKKVTGDNNIKEIGKEIIPKYKCECNKQKFERGLIALGKNELENLLKDENVETVCQFCNKKYVFEKKEIKELIDKI